MCTPPLTLASSAAFPREQRGDGGECRAGPHRGAGSMANSSASWWLRMGVLKASPCSFSSLFVYLKVGMTRVEIYGSYEGKENIKKRYKSSGFASVLFMYIWKFRVHDVAWCSGVKTTMKYNKSKYISWPCKYGLKNIYANNKYKYTKKSLNCSNVH